MKIFNPTELERLRKEFPEGSRVELIRMDDPYRKLPEGARGTVTGVDDIGTVHVCWDDGGRLGLVPGEDDFRKPAGSESKEAADG